MRRRTTGTRTGDQSVLAHCLIQPDPCTRKTNGNGGRRNSANHLAPGKKNGNHRDEFAQIDDQSSAMAESEMTSANNELRTPRPLTCTALPQSLTSTLLGLESLLE